MRIREPVNGASHLVGLLLAARVPASCSAWPDGPWQLAAFAVYGATLILLTAPAPLPRAPAAGRRLRALRTLDHIAIYFLIAGTYTPVALLTLDSRRGWTLLAGSWLIAVAGIPFKLFFLDAPVWLSTGHLSRHGLPGAGGRRPHRAGRSRSSGLAWLIAGRAGLHRRCGDLHPATSRPVSGGSDTTRSGTSWCWLGSGCHFAFMLSTWPCVTGRCSATREDGCDVADGIEIRGPRGAGRIACDARRALDFMAMLARRSGRARERC